MRREGRIGDGGYLNVQHSEDHEREVGKYPKPLREHLG